uniref:Transmembrane protein 53 n=1 Tax=Oncorhynchus mykiss TaxID=8022 RepID=A0A8K9XWT2_ONCMY
MALTLVPNESYSKTEREVVTGYKMANDGVDYTIVFPDALVSDGHCNTALKLLEILYDYEVENSPIFFHVFGTGGFMLYRYIVELLHSHKQFSTLCIVGAVVDSAPVFLPRVVLYPVTKYIHKNHYDATRESPPTWPQLYLYSRADRVIRYSDVDLMVKTPAHVSHFRDFPEEYSKRCLAFLTNCMKDSEGTHQKSDT